MVVIYRTQYLTADPFMHDILSEGEDPSDTVGPPTSEMAEAEGGGPGGGGGCFRSGEPAGAACRATAEAWRAPKAENLPMLARPRTP